MILRKILLLQLILFTAFTGSHAQDAEALKYAKTITKKDLYSYLSVLASDSLEGRETGKPGQKMAAEFIRQHFIDFGLEGVVDGDYFQEFELEEIIPGASGLRIGGKDYENGRDYIIYGSGTFYGKEIDLVFGGRGLDKELAGLDLEGKAVVLIYSGIQDLRVKSKMAKQAGALVTLLIDSEDRSELKKFQNIYGAYFSRPRMDFKMDEPDKDLRIVTHFDLIAGAFDLPASRLKEYDESMLGMTVKINLTHSEDRTTFTTENVLGFIEGTDKKDEIIVITAHYDHEGIIDGKIYNGADDDASGTSAVMEIAEAFAEARKAGKGPRRSILFMAVTGEEKGLFGSEYYSDHPVFPLANTVTNLNIDMIGRQDEKHLDNPDYVYLIGTKMLSDELHELSEQVNRTYSKLELDYTYNDKDDPNRFYYRSDHYHFAKNNIPVIFYFNGTHKDYHQPSDTIEKINFRKLQKISRFIFYTAWELANREDRVALNEQ